MQDTCAERIIRGRRSIRRFKGKQVPLDILLRLIDAARWAPSSKNRQPWEFIVVRDREKIEAIARIKGEEWIVGASAIIVGVSDPMRSPVYHMSDTAMAMHNMELLAHEIGLGTCWIGIYENDKVKRMLKIPKNKILVGAIAVGFPDERPPPRPRRSVEEIVFLEEYGRKIRND